MFGSVIIISHSTSPAPEFGLFILTERLSEDLLLELLEKNVNLVLVVLFVDSSFLR